MEPVKRRFWAKVEKTETCWFWIASRDTSGYALISVKGKTRTAHRVSYELFVGPIPKGMELDHLCRVRHCVRPSHLEVVTKRENGLRGVSFSAVNARKTHCRAGHEFTPENTYRYPTGRRECEICRRRYKREWSRKHGRRRRLQST